MGVQDLGAIGEFISSVVIVGTLIVLIYEVRGARRATLQANAQERTRRQDAVLGTLSDSPQLAAAWAKSEAHLGNAAAEAQAREFGLDPDEWRQLRSHYMRSLMTWRDAHFSELPPLERRANDVAMAATIAMNFGFRKFYEEHAEENRQGAGAGFYQHVDALLAGRPPAEA